MTSVKQMIAAGMMALSLTIGAGVASDVAADVPLGGDYHQQGCYSLEQQAKALVAEYGRADTTDERRQEIANELRQIGSDWNAIGCRSRYGDIAYKLTEPAGPYFDPGTVADPGWKTKPVDRYSDPDLDPGTIADPGSEVYR